jgi:hypothetical protein
LDLLSAVRSGRALIAQRVAEAPPHALDAALRRAARVLRHRLLPPEVGLVPPGTFAAWMRGGAGWAGRTRCRSAINDPALLADLDAFAREP